MLALANRLLASTGRTSASTTTRPAGPEPAIVRHGTEDARAGRARRAGSASGSRAGTAPSEIAVLVRMNAQLAPIEAALTRAGIPYQVRGVRFFDRPEVRGAIDLVRRAAAASLTRPGRRCAAPSASCGREARL